MSRFPELRLVEGQGFRFGANISFRGPQALWVTPLANDRIVTGKSSPFAEK